MEQSYEELKSKARISWDDFSKIYFNLLNRSLLSPMTSMMALTRIHQKQNIIDVGCGPGLSTRLISTDILNKGANIYALDFSPEMLKCAGKTFDEYDDFNSNMNNYWDLREVISKKRIEVFQDVEEIRKSKSGKLVRFILGDAEDLKFSDCQFDVYLSNLCLMLCVDVDKAIKESHRVLKENGIAAFSIWGKEEESNLQLNYFFKIFDEYGIDLSKEKSSFWLAQDLDGLKTKFYDAGFKEIRIEYTNIIYDTFDEDDFILKFTGPRIKYILSKIEDENQRNELINKLKTAAHREIVEKQQLPTLNTMIILAYKGSS